MQNFFTEKESLANKIYIVHICLFLLTLPVDRFYSEVILISLLFHTLIHLNKKLLSDFPVKKIVCLQSIFYPGIFFMLGSQYINRALTDAEIQLALLLFPFILATNRSMVLKYQLPILSTFVVGCFLAIGYCEIDALRILLFNKLPIKALLSDNFINSNFTEPLAIHPTYLAMHVALSISVLTNIFFLTTSRYKQLAYAICILLLAGSLIQLGSKSVLISLVLIVFIAFFKKGKQGGKGLPIAFFLIPIIFIFSAIYFFQDIKIRFVQNLYDDIANTHSAKSKNEFRMVRWKAAVQVIQEAPLFGHGAGSEIPVLKREYFKRKLYNSYVNELNAHNEYLSLLVKYGIVGLAVFLFVLLWGYQFAIRAGDFVFLSFLIIITVVSFSENILDVNKGVFFYAFFFAFFILKKGDTADNLVEQSNPRN